MSPESQRIAIAEAFHIERISGRRWNLKERKVLWKTEDIGYLLMEIPDYLKDLNAMHEVEKFLLLPNGCMPSSWYLEINKASLGTPERATAAQRAKALLRALGKWEDS